MRMREERILRPNLLPELTCIEIGDLDVYEVVVDALLHNVHCKRVLLGLQERHKLLTFMIHKITRAF